MSMRITVASPDKALCCGDADEICLRTVSGEIQILPGHAQYLAEVGEGVFRITSGVKILTGHTSAGIVYNHKSEISLLLFEPYKIDAEA